MSLHDKKIKRPVGYFNKSVDVGVYGHLVNIPVEVLRHFAIAGTDHQDIEPAEFSDQ